MGKRLTKMNTARTDRESTNHAPPLTGVLIVPTLLSIGFFLYDALRMHSYEYWYLVWNLFLAAVPLFFVWLLLRILRDKLWSSWSGILVSLAWLGFLPNSFYIISDYIHLQDVSSGSLLYYVVMFGTFTLTGLLYGYLSVYLVHDQLAKRMPRLAADRVIATIFLICSFAIYIGRDLRWNTWDVLLKPGGLLFDVSDRLVHPSVYPEMITTTVTFFIFITGFYYVIRQTYRAAHWSDHR
jgi:uncharacterized membrane protein